MVTTADRVRAHLRRDPLLTQGLARDVISIRRAAQWLIEANEWEVPVNTVVSALRRYEPDPEVNLADAAALIRDA